jgi:hypothetical protein
MEMGFAFLFGCQAFRTFMARRGEGQLAGSPRISGGRRVEQGVKFRRELPVAAGDCWGFPLGAQRGMGKVFSMAMPMQALDFTILAATTDLLFFRLLE